jgi:3-oxoacyl-(acyl-carrier-protein) synthase
MRRCIRAAVADAGITRDEIDTINGHLTSTGADPIEIRAWADALERPAERFPTITATKSMIGHALGAAGAIEAVASVLMLSRGFVHPCMNCEDLHPEISAFQSAIPHALDQTRTPRVLIKAGFGFGDVNGCVVFRRWEENGGPAQTP